MSKLEITFAIIKPHVVKNTFALQSIKKRIESEFRVIGSRETVITKEMAEQFYAEHRSKFFYNRLLSFMCSLEICKYLKRTDCSGPSVAMILAAENGIAKWRKIMGPTKVYRTIYTDPETIRGQFGLSDTRNACHGSDAEASAAAEIGIFFPEFSIDEWRKSQSN